MPRLGEAERKEFLEIRAACYRGLGSAELRKYVSDRLLRFLCADAYCAMELEPTTALPVHSVHHSWPDEAWELISQHVLLATPVADLAPRIVQGRRAIVVDELVDANQRPRDPYFAYHLLPFGYRHEVQAICATVDVGRALLTFTRKEGAGAFEAKHLRLLDAIAPHVAAGMHAAIIHGRISPPEDQPR